MYQFVPAGSRDVQINVFSSSHDVITLPKYSGKTGRLNWINEIIIQPCRPVPTRIKVGSFRSNDIKKIMGYVFGGYKGDVHEFFSMLASIQ